MEWDKGTWTEWNEPWRVNRNHQSAHTGRKTRGDITKFIYAKLLKFSYTKNEFRARKHMLEVMLDKQHEKPLQQNCEATV